MSNEEEERQVIVCKMPDGKVAIVVPAEGVPVEDCASHVPPEALSHRVCSTADMPQDRNFRDAWTDDAKIINGITGDVEDSPTVDVDMPKAREIHKEHLRRKRKPELLELDILALMAIEEADSKMLAIVREAKRELRDCTDDPNIALAKTPEELKECSPALLKP